jgi:hypothetical protein
VLAIYFDNVFPDVNGVRKPWFYFLSISYWTGQGTKKSEGGFVFACWVEYNQFINLLFLPFCQPK